MKEVPVESWKHFRELIDENHPSSALGTDVLYRGQSNKYWKLESSLNRSFRSGITEQEAIDLEKIILTWFQARAAVHLDPVMVNPRESYASWWTIMQHYGAPTRLIDWTESPYVAAYFAVIPFDDADGALWVVDAASVNRSLEARYCMDVTRFLGTTNPEELYTKPNRPFEVIFTSRKYMFERLIAQLGHFSICRNVLGVQEEIIENLGIDLGRPLLTKLIIPSRLKIEFLRKLKVLDVTASTLFPGLDGLGRAVKEIVRLNQG